MGVGTLRMKRKAIFLDRDGVLNEAIVKNGKPYPPATLMEVVIPEGVQTALNALKSEGFLLIGATNQPDVARGKTNRETVEAINDYLSQQLPLDNILVCYHDDADQCECRKPSPGLLTQAAAQYEIDLSRSFMIGDRWKDIEAGRKAGCKTVWLDYNYQESFLADAADFITSTLCDAAKWIVDSYKTPFGNE